MNKHVKQLLATVTVILVVVMSLLEIGRASCRERV